MVNCEFNGQINGTERYADIVAYAQASTKLMLVNCSKGKTAITDAYNGIYYSDTTKANTTVYIVIKESADVTKGEYFEKFTQGSTPYLLTFSDCTNISGETMYPDGSVREIADSDWTKLGGLTNSGNADLALSIDTLYKIISD